MIPDILKNIWHNAICKDDLNCSGVDELLEASAAKRPVIVVPMFEPIVNGNIRSIETSPKPTNGFNELIKTELLCTKIVKKQPIKIDIYPVN